MSTSKHTAYLGTDVFPEGVGAEEQALRFRAEARALLRSLASDGAPSTILAAAWRLVDVIDEFYGES